MLRPERKAVIMRDRVKAGSKRSSDKSLNLKNTTVLGFKVLELKKRLLSKISSIDHPNGDVTQSVRQELDMIPNEGTTVSGNTEIKQEVEENQSNLGEYAYELFSDLEDRGNAYELFSDLEDRSHDLQVLSRPIKTESSIESGQDSTLLPTAPSRENSLVAPALECSIEDSTLLPTAPSRENSLVAPALECLIRSNVETEVISEISCIESEKEPSTNNHPQCHKEVSVPALECSVGRNVETEVISEISCIESEKEPSTNDNPQCCEEISVPALQCSVGRNVETEGTSEISCIASKKPSINDYLQCCKEVSVRLEDIFSSTLKRQGKAHSNIGSCQCFICRGEFKCDLQSLCIVPFENVPMKKRRGRKPRPKVMYKCPLCPAKFPKPFRLKCHMTRHSDERPFTCELCSKAFKSNHNVQMHIKLRHSTERPFVCSQCSASFKDKPSLRVHAKVHGDESDSPYKCEQCSAVFKLNRTLRLHMRVHEDDRRYKCKACSAKFSQLHSIRKHVLDKHINDDAQISNCHLCSATFTSKDLLFQHLRDSH